MVPAVPRVRSKIETAALNALIRAGFEIEHVEEFCPTAAQIAAQPGLAEEVERPMFLLVSARRAG
jgi:hypothetical protein